MTKRIYVVYVENLYLREDLQPFAPSFNSHEQSVSLIQLSVHVTA